MKPSFSKAASAGSPVLVNVGGFRARSVRPTDATQEIADWFADPSRIGPLNLPPRRLALPDLRQFFAGFDNRSRFLLAMIDSSTDRICGFCHAEFSPLHRSSRISFMMGQTGFRASRAVVALALPLIDLQFRRHGIEKITAQVLTGNAAVCHLLDRLGFQREGLLRAQVRSPQGARLDQVLFGLLPGEARQPYPTRPRTAG